MPPSSVPPQHQPSQPGHEERMHPRPSYEGRQYKGSGKLAGKVALITGGDSGIGRSVAVHFAREGADVAIVYLSENDDAMTTREAVEAEGRTCLVLPADVADSNACSQVVDQTIARFGKLDCIVLNAAQQFPQTRLEDITDQQLEHTFRVNIFAHFYLTRAALPHLSAGSTIITTTSVTAYRGSEHLIDYASTKAAIVGFTRSLALAVASRQIRVNGVAPGPIWTPLIPASFSAEHVKDFGKDVPLGRPGQPDEVAPSYVFLASSDSSYMTGQILHPNGGEIINT